MLHRYVCNCNIDSDVSWNVRFRPGGLFHQFHMYSDLPNVLWSTICTLIYHMYCDLPYVIWSTICTLIYHMYCDLPYVLWSTICTLIYHMYSDLPYVLWSTICFLIYHWSDYHTCNYGELVVLKHSNETTYTYIYMFKQFVQFIENV